MGAWLGRGTPPGGGQSGWGALQGTTVESECVRPLSSTGGSGALAPVQGPQGRTALRAMPFGHSMWRHTGGPGMKR
jgi:hypothetical protein